MTKMKKEICQQPVALAESIKILYLVLDIISPPIVILSPDKCHKPDSKFSAPFENTSKCYLNPTPTLSVGG